jgi:hypothetical protein
MSRRTSALLVVLTLAAGLTVIGAPQTPQRQVFRVERAQLPARHRSP